MAMTGPTPGTLGLRYLPSRGLRDRLVAGPDAGHGVDADKYHSQGKMMQRMSFSPPPPVRPSCIDVDATSPAGQRESKGKGKALQRMSHSPSPPIRPSCIDFSGCSPGPCGPSAQSPGECAGLGMADEVGSRPYDHGKSSWGALEISASPPPRRCAARPGQDGSPRSPSSSPPARTSDSSLHEDNERAILCSPSNNRPRYFDEQVCLMRTHDFTPTALRLHFHLCPSEMQSVLPSEAAPPSMPPCCSTFMIVSSMYRSPPASTSQEPQTARWASA